MNIVRKSKYGITDEYLETVINGSKISLKIDTKSQDSFYQTVSDFMQNMHDMISDYEVSNQMFITTSQAQNLARIKTIYRTYRFLSPKDEFESHYNRWYEDYAYSTNAIEGNELTIAQTRAVMSGTQNVHSNLRAVYEIENFMKLKEYTKDLREISLSNICKINELILNRVMDDYKGKFRDVEVYLTGVDFELAPSQAIPDALQSAIQEYKKSNSHYFERIAIFHQLFEEIHPFADGNGRTGREIINVMLEQNDMPKIIVPVKQKDLYLNALRNGNEFRYEYMIKFLYDIILEESEFFEHKLKSYKLDYNF